MRPLTFIFLVSLLALSCEERPNRKAQIDQELQKVFEEFELMGLSVGLIAKGELAYSRSFGLAHHVLEKPMTTDTYLRIASISKLYTSLAVMKLWEQELVDLDTPASIYLGWELRHPKHPEVPITLRHLMDHRSGIRDGKGYSQFTSDMLAKETNIRELFTPGTEYFTEDLFADHAPGDYFSYTNCTWGLIASIIERMSGQRFDQFCREQLFAPMGVGTSFNVMDIPANEMAALYRYRDDAWQAQVDDFSENAPKERAYENYVPGTNGLIYGPQGSLRTSLNDLWVTAKMLLNEGVLNGETIIKPGTLAYFQKEGWVYDGANGDTWDGFWHAYAKGMHFIQNRPGGDIIFPDRKFYGHPGIAYGLLSDFYIDPDTRSGIIFITNGSKKDFDYAENSSFYAVEDAVFKVLYPHLQALEAE